ncbi:Uncharacterized protein PECH_001460 [Penicillium ucsense]|uniref:75k gamma secalin n=1 Tax=Penicillium ucsense TaxID=2839758 RepID=A0A8J8W8F7_9EURO|nr:Uncharacterized protein PECM_001100 [Penicillium ucsense]KAF7738232.1 Uncharacterized protein PECH_001460 [Penicillium ucsense]
MSYPPPNSGQYPQYVQQTQYQTGQVAPQPQYPFNHVAPPAQSPYGYGKATGYPMGMMQPQSWNQYGQQFSQTMPSQAQSSPSQQQQQQQQQPPALQPAPLIHAQQLVQPQYPAFSQPSPMSMSQRQHAPISQARQSPVLQQQPQINVNQQQQQSPHLQLQQSPRPQLQHQQSPRPQFQQQSPRLNAQQQSPRVQYQQHSSPRSQFQQSPQVQLQQLQHLSSIVPSQQQSPRLQVLQPSPRSQPSAQPTLQTQTLQNRQPPHQQSQTYLIENQYKQPQRQQPQLKPPQSQPSHPRQTLPQPPNLQTVPSQQPVHQLSEPLNQHAEHQPKSPPQPPPETQQAQQPRYQEPSFQPIRQEGLQPSNSPSAPKPQLIHTQQLQPPPAPPVPLPSLPVEQPQHQFINPAELFVQPPLPTAPRSRYGSLSHLLDKSELSSSLELPPIPTTLPPTAPSSQVNEFHVQEPQSKEAERQKIPLSSVLSQPEEPASAPEVQPIEQTVAQDTAPPLLKPAAEAEPSTAKSVVKKKEPKQPASTPKKEPRKESKKPKADAKVSKPKSKAASKPTPPKLAPSKASPPKPLPPSLPSVPSVPSVSSVPSVPSAPSVQPLDPSPPEAVAPKLDISSQVQPTPSPPKQVAPQVMIPAPSDLPAGGLSQTQNIPVPGKPSTQASPDRVTKVTKPPVDYQVLLLSLADEYLNAAHRHGTRTALGTSQANVEEYYKLVSTGLGCLEAVLKNWRLQPRKEALVRLRYARTLYEETENDLEAETALSKGIDLCERNRMLDLKYSMQHLLARMLHKSNPKASLKAVDGMIQDVEAYRHTAWEYTFRFLRVTLSLSSSSHPDSVQALQHLTKISTMASRNGDKAVAAMAAVIEALAHLQQGTGSDAIEQAQRALAAARSHQLNEEFKHIPQLVTLTQMVDICCSLLEYDVPQASQKLKALQTLADETLNDPNWRADGSFSVPLSGKSAGPSSIDTGDILQVQNGTLLLSFNWLPQHDLYALSYFLSSITLSAKNSYDGRKAEQFLDEGLRMIQGSFTAPQEISESMVNATKRVEWRRSLCCNFLLQRVFLACARTDWEFAAQSLQELRHFAQECGPNLPTSIQCLMEYAAGTIAQATGDLAQALSIFQSPLLSLSPSASKTARNDPCRDTCILAALNTILIIRDPSHPAHPHLPAVQATIEPFCQNGPNKYIQAAYYLVCATVQTESTIQTKTFLQHALQSATAISNSQITCMTLTFMSWKYFRGVVGEQAEKSVRAGRAMAKRANDRLWASVTDEMLAETLERHGKGDEARGVREEGQRLITGLPHSLKRPAS